MSRFKELLFNPDARREAFNGIISEVVFRFGDIVILTGTSNPQLARDVGKVLGRRVDESTDHFPDGEPFALIPRSVREKHVFIIQSTCPPNVSDAAMELFLMVDAARRSSAKEITVVLPYFGFGRSDKKDQPHVAIAAAAVASTLQTLGANRVVTVDVHAEQSQGFVGMPWDNLYASYVLIPELLKLQKKFVVVSPDSGGVRRADHYVDVMDAMGIAMAAKRRDHRQPGKSRVLTFAGDVKGQPVLIVDDVVAGGGTLFGAAEESLDHGATEVYAAVPHGLFLGDFLDRLTHSQIKMLYTTDTVRHRLEVLEHPQIRVVSTVPLIAGVIPRICTGRSISRDLILHPHNN